MKQLLPHQIKDAAFLASKSFAGNFSGMGSGKTLAALEACREVLNPDDTLIIVGPPISLHMWAEEIEDYLLLPTQMIKTGTQPIEGGAGALIMSYDIATKRRDELKNIGAKVLICDESHALKSPSAKRTKAIIGRAGICESVAHTWLLTGTPSTRWNDDLFTFLCRADNAGLKERIGNVDLSRFRLRYCITQKKRFSPKQQFPTEVTVGNRNTEELNQFIFDDGLAVRRELKEVWEKMPPITINRLQVRLDADAELKQMLKILDKKTMAEIQQQVADNDEHIATARRKIGEAKVKHSVTEIVDRVEAGYTIFILAWHTSVIDAVVSALKAKNISVAKIDGSTSSSADHATQKDWNEGRLSVLVGQTAACGTSLNLQDGGSHIVVIEEDWSPAVQDQAYARLHRMGQAYHVHVDVFEADTKLESAIKRITKSKARGHKTLMEQGHD
tara:strand:- start:3703 stop:5037 length:1335 start_codon:yes stop_codon:yes gene_type:complete